MTLEELAARTGEELATLESYRDTGLVGANGVLTEGDVERVRLIQSLARRGIKPNAVATALSGELGIFDRYLAQLYPDGDYPSIRLEDAATRAGVDLGLARRVWDAAGFAGAGERLSESDVAAVSILGAAVSIGFPEEALLQMIRVYADALGRVGEAEARLFHFYVHERLRADGLAGKELEDRTTERSEQLLALVEPAVLFFHRKGLSRAVRDDLVLHVAEEAGLLAPDDETGRLLAAVAFIDLARFTALTEAMGDGAATAILDRFSELVRRCVLSHEGRVVKQIGDAFMLVFGDAYSALDCALDIRDAALAEPHFLGTRQRLHWGPVLYREGDYYGGTVNLAARVVAEAAADQVVVTRSFREVAGDMSNVAFLPVGERFVKHVAEPVELYEVDRAEGDRDRRRVTDPVCGMVLAGHDASARLVWEGRERLFCSKDCLQRFVAMPDRYT